MQTSNLLVKLRNITAAIVLVSVTSCVNADFDLNQPIDGSIDIKGDLSLPVGNTEFIPICDFLDLNSGNGNELSVDQNGNYYLNFSGTQISQSVNINPISIAPEHLIQNGGFAAEVKVKSELTTKFPEFNADNIPIPTEHGRFTAKIPINEAHTDIYINEDISQAADILKSIKNINVDSEIRISLTTKNFNGGKIRLSGGMKIIFPSCISLIPLNSSANISLSVKGNVVTIDSPLELSGTPANINLAITGFDLDKLPEGQGFVGNKFFVSQPITLKGAEVCVDAADFSGTVGDLPDNAIFDIEINTVSFDVKGLDAVIEPVLDIATQNVSIGKLPEFLTGEGVVLDIYNPLIKMSVSNSSPVNALLNADIIPVYADGTNGSTVHIGDSNPASSNAIFIKKGFTEIYISRRGYDIPAGPLPDGWNKPINIIVDNLTDLIKHIPERLTLTNIDITVPHKGNQVSGYLPEDYTSISFPNSWQPITYNFNVDYAISSNLSFGKDLNIAYTTEFKDWNSTFNPQASNNNAASEGNKNNMTVSLDNAILSFNFINSIPLTMNVTATPIDVDGKEMSPSDVKVELSGKIPGGNIGNETITPLQIKIQASENGQKRFDGLRLNINATSPDPEFNGINLNKDQGIKLDKITAKIKGGISTEVLF